MKKILLSLLTTTAFIASTITAKGLNADANLIGG